MKIAGVRFQRLGPVKYCDSGEHDLQLGDRVLLDSETGGGGGGGGIVPDQVLYAAAIEITGKVICKRLVA